MMRLLNELLLELDNIKYDFMSGAIDEVELGLQIQWLISRIDKIEINYTIEPLDKLREKRHTKLINQLLFKSKYHAKQALEGLIESQDKHSFQIKVNSILKNKLEFGSICTILNNSCDAYIKKNQLKHVSEHIEVFRFNQVE